MQYLQIRTVLNIVRARIHTLNYITRPPHMTAMPRLSSLSVLASLAASLLLAGCGGGGDSGSSGASGGTATPAALSAMATLGKQIFFDTQLSASGKQACATCHSPTRAFTADDGLPTQMGGRNMDQQGLRNSPSLMYASYTPAFQIQADGTPVGGFFRDGRSGSMADQATHPFTNPIEMANADAKEVVSRLLSRPYLAQYQQVFGNDAAANPDQTLSNMGQALAAFEREDASFHPFSSKYDAYQSGQTQLTSQELNGARMFLDPSKGNCTACHVATGNKGVPALFTDFTYDNIGIPRNWKLAANSDLTVLPNVPQNGAGLGAPFHNYYDMGLCGPQRDDLSTHTSHCGQFKVPTLRNVAVKGFYFHNGVFDNLIDAVSWYITRDTNPAHWYVQADGITPDIPYNDLPQQYDANVNVAEVPYNPRTAPTLNDGEIKDLVSFLCTLTDGYDPQHPDSYKLPAQCSAIKLAH